MVHLILIVVLARWHNLFLLLRFAIDTPYLRAGLGKQDHLTFSNAVDKSKLDKPNHSVRINIKECIKNFPQNNPICTAILFGEEDYFFDDKTKSHPPPDGWRLEVFY